MKLAAVAPALAGGTAISTPLLAGSLAATALGGLMENRERRSAAKDRNAGIDAARADEEARQADIRARSQAALEQLTQQHSASERPAAIETQAETLVDAIAPAPLAPDAALPGQDRSSQTIREDAARRASDTAAEVRSRLAALAKLSSYDLTGQGLASARGHDAADEGVRGSMRAGGLQAMNDSIRYYDDEFRAFEPSGLSQFLSTAGQVGATVAGTGFGAKVGGGMGRPRIPFQGPVGL